VVIPVHDGGADVAACIASLLPQVQALAARLLVVDDASSDGSAETAEAAGAEVLRLPQQMGPYGARNAGWRSATTPLVVFTDVRNRAEAGWLDALVAPLRDPDVAIAGGHVRIGGGDRLAHRLARRQSHVDPVPLLADDFLPYVTTSSMAVRRAALEAVGGFEERRSGADADLCWRIQQAGAGRVVLAPESHMVCEPRSSVRAVWRQWWRYARSFVEVRTRFGPEARGLDHARPLRGRLRAAAGRVVRDPRSVVLEAADVVRFVGYELAYRRARRQVRRTL
jgi:GT2 family glycosyltransferase